MNLPLILISTLPRNSASKSEVGHWQELFSSDLTGQGLQVDLVRGTADWAEREPLGERVAIPAGIYPPVRLRFVPNQLVTEHGVAEENSCSSGRFNCITEDGRIHRSCSMVVRYTSASCQIELRVVLFCSLPIPTLM